MPRSSDPSASPDPGAHSAAAAEAVLDPERWVADHGDALLRYALPRVRDRHAAEDLVQETLLAALSARNSFRGGSAVRTWLVGILRHKLVDHLRCSTRQRPAGGDEELEARLEATFDERGAWRQKPGEWSVDPDDLVERGEFWEVFEGCLEGVPERPGEAFALRVLEGLGSREVCKVLGISSTNLWVLLHRARARLRDCLEARWFEPAGGEDNAPTRAGERT